MGDHIIVDSIRRILEKNLPNSIFVNVATHDYLTSEAYKIIDSSDITLVCGTNLLCGNLDTYKQWKVQARDFLMLRNVGLMGVGWWQYQETITPYTESFYNLCLSSSISHSVRDEYTRKMLLKAVPNRSVLNTACPTMWTLTSAHINTVNKVARTPSDACVTTVTDYKADPQRDISMLNALLDSYKEVYVWIQGEGDARYLGDISMSLSGRLMHISPTLSAYDEFLRSRERLDFMGTRLHAGIRALQWGHPATIVEVDNRAKEISNDTGLKTWPRDQPFEMMIKKHRESYNIILNLPKENIYKWINEVKTLLEASN